MSESDPEHAFCMMLAFLDGVESGTSVEERARLGLEYLDGLGFGVNCSRVEVVKLDRTSAGIRSARRALRLSQRQLAKAAGLSAATLTTAETNEGRVKDVTLDAIVAALVRFGALKQD